MTPPSAPQDPSLLRRLLRAKDQLDAAPSRPWTIPQLARLSHTSVKHFARAFRQAFGLPPHRYLLTRRVERAAALLRDTELPITTIAFESGWQSLGTFTRTFRDVTGETPSAARTRLRAEARGLTHVPPCFLAAGTRPHLTMAVSEKRRRARGAIHGLRHT